MLAEDSFLKSCFSGKVTPPTYPLNPNFLKFLVVAKCKTCNESEYIEEDFLSLNFEAFQQGQADHIKVIRDSFGSDVKSKSKWGIFKVFSKYSHTPKLNFLTWK